MIGGNIKPVLWQFAVGLFAVGCSWAWWSGYSRTQRALSWSPLLPFVSDAMLGLQGPAVYCLQIFQISGLHTGFHPSTTLDVSAFSSFGMCACAVRCRDLLSALTGTNTHPRDAAGLTCHTLLPIQNDFHPQQKIPTIQYQGIISSKPARHEPQNYDAFRADCTIARSLVMFSVLTWRQLYMYKASPAYLLLTVKTSPSVRLCDLWTLAIMHSVDEWSAASCAFCSLANAGP